MTERVSSEEVENVLLEHGDESEACLICRMGHDLLDARGDAKYLTVKQERDARVAAEQRIKELKEIILEIGKWTAPLNSFGNPISPRWRIAEIAGLVKKALPGGGGGGDE